MQVIERVAEVRALLDAARCAGRAVGLVPTMGALHDGHASLVERAAGECEVVCATVFVNPLQFGDGEDFSAYPRDLERDALRAEKAGATVVFAPPIDEMYPDGQHGVRTAVAVRELTERLEGAHRPGHFDGVATVVTKLFAIAGPCRAYFGEKDYQQLLVVRQLAHDLSFPVDVIGCATVRERDGLALSSRNAYLGGEEREAAAVLSRALQAGAAAIIAGERSADAVRALITGIVTAEPLADLEYADVADPGDLTPLGRIDGDVRLLIAARVGPARLIDNLGVRT